MEAYAFLVVILIIFSPTFLQLIWNGIISLIKKRKLPPGPNGLPIIGSLLSINGDTTHQSLVNLAQFHGPLMTLKLGFVNVVVASSAEMAKQILQKHELEFIGRPVPDAATSEQGYELALPWLPVGPHWKKLRKICNTHLMTPHKLDLARESRHRVMRKVMERVAEASDAGEAVRIERLALGAVVRLLSNSMFSDDVEELEVLLGGDLMGLLGKANVGDYFPFLRAFDLQGIRRGTGRFYDRMHELIDGVIDKRMDRRRGTLGSDRVGDFLDVLLDYMEDDGSEGLTRLDVRLMIMELFIGGTDSSTTTVEWAMTELLRNPTILSKLKQQLSDQIPPPNTLQEQHIPHLPYLTAVIKETMRLHPPSALLLPRRAEQDVNIQGFHIPKNTRILLNVLSITRDASYWDRPTCFVPERFLDSDIDFRGTNFSFIPFSSGRRMCPGMNLGVRMVSLILGSLVHEFEWKLPDGMTSEDVDVTERFGLTLRKAEPLVAIPVRINYS